MVEDRMTDGHRSDGRRPQGLGPQGLVPQGLMVDYGGVLTSSITRSFRRFCEELGLERELVKKVFLEAYTPPGGSDPGGDGPGGSNPGGNDPGGDGPVHQVETGRISGEEFAVLLAASLSERAGVHVAPDDLLRRLFAHVEPNEPMWAAVTAARRAGIRTCLLSNSWGDDGYPRKRLHTCFDALVISGEVGLRKPDPPIYLLAAERLALPTGACVFVDDLDTNVRAAERAGMLGVVHRRTDETLARLGELFGLELELEPGGPSARLRP